MQRYLAPERDYGDRILRLCAASQDARGSSMDDSAQKQKSLTKELCLEAEASVPESRPCAQQGFMRTHLEGSLPLSPWS